MVSYNHNIMSTISRNLHVSAYDCMREYLDFTYSLADNKKIYALSIGYPMPGVYPLPVSILEKMQALSKGVEIPRPGYGWEAGSKPLREQLIEYENLRHKTTYSLNNICITAGATYALNRVMERIFEELKDNRNDLLIVSPTFYRMTGRFNRYGNVKNICAEEETNYQITIEKLLNSITKKTKAIFLFT